MGSQRAWTNEEAERLRSAQGKPLAELAAAFGRTKQSVYKARQRLRNGGSVGRGPRGSRPNDWTPDDDATIRATVRERAQDVADRMGRTRAAVLTRRRRLGVTRPDGYSPDEEAAVRAWCESRRGQPFVDYAALAASIGRTTGSVMQKARRMGLADPDRNHMDCMGRLPHERPTRKGAP